MAKVDADRGGPTDVDDIPELTDEFFDRAELKVGGVPVRRGRPAPNGTKQQITLRLDPAVVAAFKATGPGWQGRINAVLRDWLSRGTAPG